MGQEYYYTESVISGGGSKANFIANGIVYLAQTDGDITWENREEVFQQLLNTIPDDLKPIAEAEYDKFCEALRNTENEEVHEAIEA